MFRLLSFISLFLFSHCVLTLSATGLSNKPGKSSINLSAEAALYKYIIPRPLTRSTDLHNLKIVVPDDTKWKNLGGQLADLIRERWNISTPVIVADSAKFTTTWTGNTLILGHLGNNTRMARLYGLRMSYADGIYPGNGGYQLATLIDPFGVGGNTVIIGASDFTGAQHGVNQLIQILKNQAAPSIPWVLKASLAEETGKYFPESASNDPKARQLLKKLKPIKDNETVANSLIEVLSQIKQYGEFYQLTGNPAFGSIYSLLLKEYTMFVNQFPEEAKNQLESRRNMWIQGEKLFQQWTVLEADPLFTQLNRSQILSALYLTCEANANDGYLLSAPKTGSRWNHQIFPAVSLSGSCSYFENYYNMPEIPVWKQRADQIFTGNTSYISLDEGSDYLVHVPMVNIDYGMATGDLKYISRSLRPSADLNAMMIDNLGTMSGGGDTYPFGMSSAYSWGHSQVMNAAAWYYHDPVYQFLLERTRTGPFAGQKMPDLKYPIHRYIVSGQNAKLDESNYPKVMAQPVEPGVYNELKETEVVSVPQSMTFHKLTFREGFDMDDNYLIVDGFSAGRHGHQDGNAILNYSANGRLFLNDRDYIQNTPEHHSGVVIIKDCEQHKKPPLAKLEWVADLEGTSISRSRVPDYNDTDWDRTIISPSGKFFIIYDEVNFKKKGDFIVKNLWQSLGTPKIEKNTFTVDQKGVSMLLQSMNTSRLGLKDLYGHFIKYWKTVYPYPYADQETVLSEVIDEKGYAAGEKAGFVNVLSSYKNSENPVKSVRIDGRTISVSDGRNTWLAIEGGIENRVLRSNGLFHILGNNEFIAAGVTNINLGNDILQFPQPVFFKMNTLTGNWKTYSLLKNKIVYNDKGDAVQQLSLDGGTVKWNSSLQEQLEKYLQPTDAIQPTQRQTSMKAVPLKGWKKLYQLDEKVSSSACGDLNNDGRDEILIAGINGTLKAVDKNGKLLWSFKAKGRINEVTVQSAGTKRLVFLATDNWYVQALDTNGKELWSHRFPDDDAHREFKGNLIGITNVRVAYPHGKDREPSVMVGTQFRYLYELDLAGNVKNDTMLYFYGIEDMEYADLDGDGLEEGMFGLEYYYYTLLTGKKQIQGKTGGPGWKIVDVLNKGKKNPYMLLGSKQGEVRMIGFKEKIKEEWVKNVGGEVNDIRHGDFDNDGKSEILVATEGFQFYVLHQDGTTAFRKTLGNRVLKVDGIRQNGKVWYLAATAQGRLFKFSSHGTPEQPAQFPYEIANILTTSNGAWIVLQNGDLYRMDQ